MSREYYVSSLIGSDSFDGTKERPFCTLFKINELCLEAGDKIFLECGSVFENQFLKITASGTKDAPIIIGAYGKGNPPQINTNSNGIWVLNKKRMTGGVLLGNENGNREVWYMSKADELPVIGSDQPPTYWYQPEEYVSSCVLLYDAEYVTIKDIYVTNKGLAGETYSATDKMNRTGVCVVAQNKGVIHNITIENMIVRNIAGNVYSKSMCNGGIICCAIKPTTGEDSRVPRFEGITVKGCHVEKVSRTAIEVGSTYKGEKFPEGTLDDETFKKYGHYNIIISDNYLKDVGGDGIIVLFSFAPIIEHNICDTSSTEMNDKIFAYHGNRFHHASAGMWPWKCKNAIFRYNETTDTKFNQDGTAYDFDYADGTTYEYNFSRMNEGGCVLIMNMSVNNTFRNNLSVEDLSGIFVGDCRNGCFCNNKFYLLPEVRKVRRDKTQKFNNGENNEIIYLE